MRKLPFLVLLHLLSLTLFAAEWDNEDWLPVYEDLIHADLPLWGDETQDVSPFHYYEDGGSFGCAHRIGLGDWQLKNTLDNEPSWYRFTNYGAFHCFVLAFEDMARERLEHSFLGYSIFIRIGQVQHQEKAVDLWVLQIGGRPGSDYLLLATDQISAGITRFDLLQRKCPDGKMRQGPSLDSLQTDYCAINSQDDMVALARQMLTLPPIGRMTLAEDAGQSNH